MNTNKPMYKATMKVSDMNCQLEVHITGDALFIENSFDDFCKLFKPTQEGLIKEE